MTTDDLAIFARCRVLAGIAMAQAQAMPPIGKASPPEPPRPLPMAPPRLPARPADRPRVDASPRSPAVSILTDRELSRLAGQSPRLVEAITGALAKLRDDPSPRNA